MYFTPIVYLDLKHWVIWYLDLYIVMLLVYLPQFWIADGQTGGYSAVVVWQWPWLTAVMSQNLGHQIKTLDICDTWWLGLTMSGSVCPSSAPGVLALFTSGDTGTLARAGPSRGAGWEGSWGWPPGPGRPGCGSVTSCSGQSCHELAKLLTNCYWVIGVYSLLCIQ